MKTYDQKHHSLALIYSASDRRFRVVCTGKRFEKTLLIAAELLELSAQEIPLAPRNQPHAGSHRKNTCSLRNFPIGNRQAKGYCLKNDNQTSSELTRAYTSGRCHSCITIWRNHEKHA